MYVASKKRLPTAWNRLVAEGGESEARGIDGLIGYMI